MRLLKHVPQEMKIVKCPDLPYSLPLIDFCAQGCQQLKGGGGGGGTILCKFLKSLTAGVQGPLKILKGLGSSRGFWCSLVLSEPVCQAEISYFYYFFFIFNTAQFNYWLRDIIHFIYLFFQCLPGLAPFGRTPRVKSGPVLNRPCSNGVILFDWFVPELLNLPRNQGRTSKSIIYWV